MPKHGKMVGFWLVSLFALATIFVSSSPTFAQGSDQAQIDRLQVMFLDGASIHVDPSPESDVISVANCGTILPAGIQDGPWFAVEYDGQEGWVNGYLVSSEISSTDYCKHETPSNIQDLADGIVPPSPDVATNSGSIEGIICTAAATYGQSCQAMISVAWCESTFNPYAVGGMGEMGLFQFLPGTWASTPFAGTDAFNASNNAHAAAWMWSVGRQGEWACQP